MISINNTRLALLILALSILSGCGGLNRIALKKDANLPQKTEARLIIPADEIIVRSKPSNISAALGGGLIPALIDASITASRQTELEKISTPFYNETVGINIRELFAEEFKPIFNSQKSLPNTNLLITNRAISKNTMAKLQSNLNATESLMAIRIWYEFSSDAKNVIVIAGVYMAEPLKKEPAYRNILFYLSKPADILNEESPLSYWSKNKGERLKKVYADSASILAKLLIDDLEAPSNKAIKSASSEKKEAKISIPYFNQQFLFTPSNGIVRLSESGFVLEEDDSKKILRGKSGAIYWIEK